MSQAIDKSSGIPLYKQVVESIRRDIHLGLFKAGQQIPTEPELEKKYGVSRVTVRNAVLELVKEGLLVRYQGKGTFVQNEVIEHNVRLLNSFSEICREKGMAPGSVLLESRFEAPSGQDLKRLELAPAENIFAFRRLRLADHIPIMIEDNHFPGRYSFLSSFDFSSSLYSVLRQHNIIPTRITKVIDIAPADKETARLLETSSGHALLRVDTLVYDKHGVPLHTCLHLIKSEFFKLTITTGLDL